MNRIFRPSPLESIDEPDGSKTPPATTSPFSTRYSDDKVQAQWELKMATPVVSPETVDNQKSMNAQFASSMHNMNISSDVDSPNNRATPRLSKPEALELE